MNNEEKILEKLDKHEELFEKILNQMAQMQSTQAQMQEDIRHINARLDFDVEKRFDAVNEGIDAILEQLTPRSRVDALEADVVVLKTAIKALIQEVAELKKAQ